MCGGVAYKYKNIKETDLKKYYSADLLDKFLAANRVESFFWHKQAVLPIKWKGKTELRYWGNKDSDLKLPKTGWARQESLQGGKWDYLHPEIVDIPVEAGYEKKVWFDFEHGTKGVLVKKDGEERVYIITKEADNEYMENTKHDREPVGEKRFLTINN